MGNTNAPRKQSILNDEHNSMGIYMEETSNSVSTFDANFQSSQPVQPCILADGLAENANHAFFSVKSVSPLSESPNTLIGGGHAYERGATKPGNTVFNNNQVTSHSNSNSHLRHIKESNQEAVIEVVSANSESSFEDSSDVAILRQPKSIFKDVKCEILNSVDTYRDEKHTIHTPQTKSRKRTVGRPAKEIPDAADDEKCTVSKSPTLSQYLREFTSDLDEGKLATIRKIEQRKANNIASRICRKKRKEKMLKQEEECENLLIKNKTLKKRLARLEKMGENGENLEN